MNIDSRDLSTADLLPEEERRAMTDTERSEGDAVDLTDDDGFDRADAPPATMGTTGPMGTTGTMGTTGPMGSRTPAEREEDTELLFGSADSAAFEERWTDVQTRFVDDPREAVESADHLVAEVMQALARRFAEHKAMLEDEWSGGGDSETEELRQAFRRYRAFFHRLLAV